MNSLFLGLEIARSGLNISQKYLDVVSQNIANANTKGYTRQRVVSVPAAKNMGVEFVSVEQVRDKFLENQYRNELSSLGEWEVKSEALLDLESIMQEPSDNGLSTALNDFFSSVQQVSLQPEAKEIRTQMRQNAIKLTDNLSYLYNKMVSMQEDYNAQIEDTVNEINNYAKNIQSLNAEIQRIEVSGQNANELRDQRNVLINDLSKLVNITTSEGPNGSFSIMIGGEYLVNNTEVNLLETAKEKANPIAGEADLNVVKWASSGSEVSIEGGVLKGYYDIICGAGKTQADDPKAFGIPYFVNQLNLFAAALAKAVNDIHSTGYSKPDQSNGNVSKTGINFFEAADGQADITAKNITVSKDIMDSVYNIAASDVQVNDYNVGNNNIIKKISDLQNGKSLTVNINGIDYNIGSFDGFVKEIVSDMAIESSFNQKMKEGQENITSNVENKINSVSGVSIDEEMTNMIQFQHSYSAAARVISTIDEMLDTLINIL